MPRQGRLPSPRELTPVDLDRLAGLRQFIRPEVVEQALQDTDRATNRSHCRLTHRVMLWVVLGMGLLTDLPIREVFRHAAQLPRPTRLPGRAALCRARHRLGPAPLRRLFEQVVQPLARPERPGGHYRGWHLVGIDGTVLDVPDSAANDRAFGRPTGGRGVGAFPQVRKLSLVELGTHVELGFVAKPCCRSEVRMVGGLLRWLRPGMLALCDRNFFSYRFWSDMTKRGVQALFRIKTNLILRPDQVLSDGSFLSQVYPSPHDRERGRGGIVVRVIRYTLDDPKRVGYKQTHTLLTTLLDPDQDPAIELILLYHERWEQELVFDEQKTHQAPRMPGKEAQLRSETPAGVIQELYALSLAHYVVRGFLTAAAATVGIDPDRVSFVAALRILRLRLPACPSEDPAGAERWYQEVLAEIAAEKLPSRRDRVNPRVIKRKMSKFAKKRPVHRGIPTLKRKFRDIIVMQT
jgi:Insertion element 4 transposase N-terminal/Transposase DDE domain